MHFTLATLAIALVSSFVGAVDLIGYSTTVNCDGDSFQCGNVGGAVCCGPFPTGFGFSMEATNLPSGTQAQGYSGSNGCSAFLFSLFGPGTKCWNGGGASLQFANWFPSPAPHTPARRVANSSSAVCIAPNIFAYTDDTGAQRKIKVPGPTAEAAEAIAQLRIKGDFAALAQYEVYP